MAPWRLGPLLLAAVVATGQTDGIRIRVVEGEGAINNIRHRRAKDPVVVVENLNGRPVAGANVNFLLPASGPSGTFLESGLSLTAASDENGRAVGRGLRPNRVVGSFQIRVTASREGRMASAVIGQTNAEPAAGKGSRRTAILAIVGGVAVGGLVAATRRGGGGASGGVSPPPAAITAPPPTSVTPGSPTIGPPR